MPRQNFVAQSSDLTHASWTRSDLSAVTSLGNVGPAGVPAFRLTDNSTPSGYHALIQSVAGLTFGRVVTFSVLARAGTKSRLSLQSSSGSIAVVFNIATLQTWVGGSRLNEISGYGCEPVGDGWVRCWMTYVVGGSVPAGHNIYMIDIDGLNIPSYSGDGTGTLDLAAPMVTESKAPPAEIVVGTAAVNEGAPRGRAPRQNLFLRSPNMATGWTLSAVTVANDPTVLAPDGSATATRVTEAAGTFTHSIGQSANVIAARTYTFSAYVRRSDGATRTMFMLGDGGNVQGFFDLGNGIAAGLYNPLGYAMRQGIENAGGGWFRLWITIAVPATTSRQWLIYPTDGTSFSSLGSANIAGDTSRSFLVWGAQLTESSYPVDIVAVTATAVNEGAPRGRMPRQNLLANSSTASAWLPLNADASAQGGGVIRVTERNNNAEHIVYQQPSGNQPAGLVHTITLTARAGSRSLLWVRGPAGSTRQDSAFFDLANGTVGTLGSLATRASIEPLGDGWYRCSVSFTGTASPQYAACIGTAAVDGTYAYLGNGTGYLEFRDVSLTETNGLAEHVATIGVAVNSGAPRSLGGGAPRTFAPRA